MPDEDYTHLAPGLEDALAEVQWKIDWAKKTNARADARKAAGEFWGIRYVDAYLAALEEVKNTLTMRLNQAKRNERPGLWSTTMGGRRVS